MPIDEGTRGVNPVAKPKPKPKPSPGLVSRPEEGTRPDKGTRQNPMPALTPRPPPDPFLVKYFNYHGSVEGFNARLEEAKKSHDDWAGYRISGGLAYDIVKSPIKDEQIPRLFDVPRTKKAAVAASFAKPDAVGRFQKTDPFSQLVAQSAELAPAPLSDDELVDGLTDAAKMGKDALRAFREEHKDQIDAVSDRYGVGQSPLDLRNAPPEVRTASVMPLNRVDEAFGIAMLGVAQISTALLVGPVAIAQAEGVAAKESIEQRSLRPLGEANFELGKAAVVGFYEDGKAVATGDWEYIAANPGYIAMDIMGVAGVTGKVLRAGAGTRTLVKGGIEVEALRSENAGAALVQDAIRYRRQKAANRRHDTEDVVIDSSLGHFAQKNLGFERKVGRELERERKLQVALGDMVRRDLDRVTGWSTRRASVMKAVGFKAHRGLTRGEQMALFVESLDEPGTWADRAALLRQAHEGWLRDGIGSHKAHEQKLRDITLAEQAMKKPSPRYQEALALTREAVAQMEELKVRELGLDARVAAERVAAAGRVLRTGGKRDVTAEARLAELEKFVGSRVDQVYKYLKESNPSATIGGDKRSRRVMTDADRAKTHAIGQGDAIDPSGLKPIRAQRGDAETRARAEEILYKRAKASEHPTLQRVAAAIEEMDSLRAGLLEQKAAPILGTAGDGAELARFAEGRQRGESFYVPTVSAIKSRPLAKTPFRGVRFSNLGLTEPNLKRLVPELSHQFTGEALRAGTYRIDTTRLVGEAVGRTVRAASVISQYKTLLKSATDTPRSEFDRPIRLSDGIPDELRAIVNKTDEGELVASEVGALSKTDADAMLRELFPGQRAKDGRWLVDKEIQGVKWVDERLIDSNAWTQPMPTGLTRGASALNSPFRFVTLYLRPAYLLNLLGATGMALMYQGPFLPKNVVRAVFAEKLYGPKVNNGLRELVGSGRTISYVNDRPVTRATRQVAGFWNTVTDERLRMSTAFYYGRKKGIKTREQWEGLLDDARKGDGKAFDKLNEITDRTKKAMGQFDNLTWVEQNVLRHAIFIYPWQRAATVWSVRTLVERPVTSAVLAQIGADSFDDIDDFLGKVPGWVKSAGFLPLGYDDEGNPRVVNPSGLNTFSTLNGLMHSRVDQLLGPAGELAVRAATERDEFGNEYPSVSRVGRWRDAANDVLNGLPQLIALAKSQRKDETLPPVDVTDRGSLQKQVNDALALTVMSPGWLDGFGMLITGAAATPRSVDKLALTARWYRDAPLAERQAFQKELMNRALGIQADMIGRRVNPEVSKLVNFQFDLDVAVDAKQRELARDLTPREQTLVEIAFYKGKRLLDEDDSKDLVQQTKTLSAEEHEAFRRDLFGQYADPLGRLKEWDASVRRVNALATPEIVNERLRRLTESGVNDAAGRTVLTRAQLKGYAHKADAYARELTQRTLEIAELKQTNPVLVSAAEAELLAWKSEQDEPVKVDGRLLPSPARMEWAKELNFQERKQNVAALASRPWSGLTKFEKELLGTKTDAKIASGWERFEEIRTEQLQGERTPAGYDVQLARYLNRESDGFYKDWLFSEEPLAVRLQRMKPIQQSAHRATWDAILADANVGVKALKNPDTPKEDLREKWRAYVREQLASWATEQPGFADELELYGGPRILYDLLS